jgi:hypothetical protein
MEFKVVRTLENSFPNAEETCGHRLDHDVEVLRLTVMWPADAPPTSVWAIRGRAGRVNIPLGELADRQGRRVLENYEIANARGGDTIAIGWRW